MSTPLLRASNWRNSQHSTGPVTERGRAAVRANAFKHGFYARVPLDDAESHEDYSACLDDFLADLRPAGAVEIELTHRYVAELWKLSRMERVERAIILGHAITTPFEYPECAGDTGQQTFFAFRDWVEVSMCQYTNPGQAPIERLHLLQNRLRRAADSTLRLLTTLQAERFRASAPVPADSSLDADSAHDPLQPSAPLDPLPARPPFSVAGQDRAHRVAPEVRERARMRERLAQLAEPTSPAIPSSPVGTSQPGPISESAPPSAVSSSPAAQAQPGPGTEAAPPSKTTPAENVTPPTPSKQTSNQEIGFVPHKRKSSPRAAPHAPPKAA